MNQKIITYQCIRGHVTEMAATGERIKLAIICSHTRTDGKICKESAYYQPADAELNEAPKADKDAVFYLSGR